MQQPYDGLPAAVSVQEAILLAQLLILGDLERKALRTPDRPASNDREVRPAA